MSEIKTIVVVRVCVVCKKQVEHEINKEGWGDRAYGEAVRVWNEIFTCPDCTPTYPDHYDWD